ncbi:MAG: electron transfer flavoprotein, partial [Desulfobacterales bacterium]
MALISPANASFFGIPAFIFSILIPVIGIGFFIYIINKRLAPLLKASPDFRFDRIPERIAGLIKLWFIQYRQPRYMLAGVLHIMIFAGFIILSVRSTSLVVVGFWDGFILPGFDGIIGHFYNILKDYAATMVLVACIIAAVRRGFFKPKRYAVPEKYGKDHTVEAIFVLGLISTLMISESLFEASFVAAQVTSGQEAEFLAPGTLVWVFKNM